MEKQLLAVTGVLLLLGAALWWLRSKGLAQYRMRLSSGGRKRILESIERLPLSPQHSLHLVRLAGRGLLVATSPTGCAVLESFDLASMESPRAGEVR